jgi:uncharacterized protein with PIN domain
MTTLRFYAELNDYLSPKLRRQDIGIHLAGPCPVRHLIETHGVPHTEVEVILINGVSVDLEAPVHDGDLVSVYPMFEALDVSPLLRLRPEPLREPRFFADAQLGRLARHLRLLGFDTRYENSIDDADLVRRAAAERRIILSRDRALLMRRDVTHGCHIRQDDPREQLTYVIRRCDLSRACHPFTRCIECNGRLEAVSKDKVADKLEPETAACFDEFWRCEGCGGIYWKGSHYDRLQQLASNAIERARLDNEQSGFSTC